MDRGDQVELHRRRPTVTEAVAECLLGNVEELSRPSQNRLMSLLLSAHIGSQVRLTDPVIMTLAATLHDADPVELNKVEIFVCSSLPGKWGDSHEDFILVEMSTEALLVLISIAQSRSGNTVEVVNSIFRRLSASTDSVALLPSWISQITYIFGSKHLPWLETSSELPYLPTTNPELLSRVARILNHLKVYDIVDGFLRIPGFGQLVEDCRKNAQPRKFGYIMEEWVAEGLLAVWDAEKGNYRWPESTGNAEVPS
ncbi:hypothetical protein QBC35DRAFT_466277 [Podospora australis]|uniref:Uncharacterized protein n=1 Tax=Podospora australis TaxID=1536484 RepID=A0AAN6WNN8_9PEZI|nr:hypothetical protein QBC35DRAFT_466277 [Podospora australis]